MNPSTDQYHDHQDTLEGLLMCTKYHQERNASTPVEQAQKCPRCGSTDTKFCYYNNYSLSQPRYYCKYCRRYWTKGGALRNVPVGGGCRNNKTSSSSSSSSSSSNSETIQHSYQQPSNISPLSSIIPPPLSYDPSDELTLAFARLQKRNSLQSLNNNEFSMMGNLENIPYVTSTTTTPYVVNHGGFDGVRNSFLETSLNGFGNYVYGNNMNNYDMGYVQNGGEGIQYEDLGGTTLTSTSTSTGVMPELQNLRDGNGESRPYQIHDYNNYYYY